MCDAAGLFLLEMVNVVKRQGRGEAEQKDGLKCAFVKQQQEMGAADGALSLRRAWSLFWDCVDQN